MFPRRMLATILCLLAVRCSVLVASDIKPKQFDLGRFSFRTILYDGKDGLWLGSDRDGELLHFDAIAGKVYSRILLPGERVRKLVASPDFRTLIAIVDQPRRNPRLFVLDSEGKRQREIGFPDLPVRHIHEIAFSSDGKHIAFGGFNLAPTAPRAIEGAAVVTRWPELSVVRTFPSLSDREVDALAFTDMPNGVLIGTDHLEQYELGKAEPVAKTFQISCLHITVHPFGRLASVQSGRSLLWDIKQQTFVWDSDFASETPLLESPQTSFMARVEQTDFDRDYLLTTTSMVFWPDGETVTCAYNNGPLLRTWDIKRGKVLSKLSSHLVLVTPLAIGPNNTLVMGVVRVDEGDTHGLLWMIPFEELTKSGQ